MSCPNARKQKIEAQIVPAPDRRYIRELEWRVAKSSVTAMFQNFLTASVYLSPEERAKQMTIITMVTKTCEDSLGPFPGN